MPARTQHPTSSIQLPSSKLPVPTDDEQLWQPQSAGWGWKSTTCQLHVIPAFYELLLEMRLELGAWSWIFRRSKGPASNRNGIDIVELWCNCLPVTVTASSFSWIPTDWASWRCASMMCWVITRLSNRSRKLAFSQGSLAAWGLPWISL